MITIEKKASKASLTYIESDNDGYFCWLLELTFNLKTFPLRPRSYYKTKSNNNNNNI